METPENIFVSEKFTHKTAPTKSINVNGSDFTYRSFGRKEGIPVIFLQHFTGNMDNWDPEVTNAIASNYPVILFNNKGVGSSKGTTPDNVSAMAQDAVDFIRALGYSKVNLLGFSLGGFIGQHIAAEYPELVNKLILAGTGSIGGKAIAQLESHLEKAFVDGPDRVLINLFFSKTPKSIKAGEAFLERLAERKLDRDLPTSQATIESQARAIIGYGLATDEGNKQLKAIKQPVLIVNGSEDNMVDSINSYIMLQNIPDAKLVLWSDSGHGGIFQYSRDFAHEVNTFLLN
ncbi:MULTISPECIES: alpha/beta hydrolase [unclassified Arcicella]|uniref:alpha/beta fold hydrolase n=1 Tax=unclassified Arcicella TaxID=2644986 RepID=UPI00285C4D81|nr:MULTISPECIES: alpha/beta hydrolase [unclassified Arcicella]MDR6562250.1 pimeloyl-ACP methyl ester carboxylesterase [Arcicella sp. BE51]MDR6812056.1 pimeloyl-ACP methyl ester carboxylesterase [Arcicella sp. BE140]MDR6823367.1 pimeloyl-ACP methyl ester carboxylesterase [Arcicella sp. BE139]